MNGHDSNQLQLVWNVEEVPQRTPPTQIWIIENMHKKIDITRMQRKNRYLQSYKNDKSEKTRKTHESTVYVTRILVNKPRGKSIRKTNGWFKSPLLEKLFSYKRKWISF